jgi:hypothetical protein
MEIFYVILWVICGAIAMSIYSRKGRSPLVGCLGGFLLGPIGILLALASGTDRAGMNRKAAEEAEQQVRDGILKKCPHCAELIKAEAGVCRFCGQEVAR